jgi:hypothetical protein
MAEFSINKLDNDIIELIVKFEDRSKEPLLSKDIVSVPYFVRDKEGKLLERITKIGEGVNIAPFTFAFQYKLIG